MFKQKDPNPELIAEIESLKMQLRTAQDELNLEKTWVEGEVEFLSGCVKEAEDAREVAEGKLMWTEVKLAKSEEKIKRMRNRTLWQRIRNI